MMRIEQQMLRTTARTATLLLVFVMTGCAQERSEKAAYRDVQPATVPVLPSAAPEPLAQKDCSSAQHYRDNICDLAKRICGLQPDPGGNASAGNANAGSVGTGDYCKDAQTRCDEAKQRWQADCE